MHVNFGHQPKINPEPSSAKKLVISSLEEKIDDLAKEILPRVSYKYAKESLPPASRFPSPQHLIHSLVKLTKKFFPDVSPNAQVIPFSNIDSLKTTVESSKPENSPLRTPSQLKNSKSLTPKPKGSSASQSAASSPKIVPDVQVNKESETPAASPKRSSQLSPTQPQNQESISSSQSSPLIESTPVSLPVTPISVAAKAKAQRESMPLFAFTNHKAGVLQQAQQRQANRTKEGLATSIKNHKLSSVVKTQNPVTRIKATDLIAASAIQSASNKAKTPLETRKLVKSLIFEHYHKHSKAQSPHEPGQSPSAKQIYLFFSEDISDIIEPGKGREELSVIKLEREVMEALDDRIETLEDFGQKGPAQALKELKKTLEGVFKKINTHSIEKYRQKDDLLSKISILEAKFSEQLMDSASRPSAQERLIKLTEIRNQLKNLNSSLVPESVLKQISSSFLKETDIRKFIHTAQLYYSSSDILAANEYSPGVQKMINSIASTEKTAQNVDLSFKLGVENAREILANEINLLLEANPYLSTKAEVVLENASLGESTSSRGLSSTWLTDGQAIHTSTLTQYFNDRQTIAALEFQGKPVPDDLRERFEQEQTSLRSNMSSKSVLAHTLQDIEMQTYDSHSSQYANVDGNVYCFDFARHLAPSTCFMKTNSFGETLTHVAFRSTFLDFPVAKDPLPDSFINHIQNRNMEEVEKELRKNGRIGDPIFFKEAKTAIEEMDQDSSKAKDSLYSKSLDILQETCAKYDVVFLSNDPKTSYQNLSKRLNELKKTIQEGCFRQIHPQAFENWKSRVSLMQDYVRHSEAPTMEGLRNAAYPELAIFFKVLERLAPNPSGVIGVGVANKVAFQTNLESVIEQAQESGLASEDEIELMHNNLRLLQAQACSSSDLTLTMNLS